MEEVYSMILISILRHLDESYQKQHGYDNQSDNEIRSNQDAKVAFFDCLKFTVVKQCAVFGTHRMQFRLNELHGYIHSEK